MDLNGFDPGIYVCTLVCNTKTISSRKFIVK